MPMMLDVQRTFFNRSERVKSVDFHQSEPWLLVGLYNGHVVIWNFESNSVVKDFEISQVPVRCARFLPKRNWIVTGSDDFQLRCFNINTMEKVTAFEAHPDYIRALAVHPSSPYVLTGSDDMTIKMWDYDNNWKCVRTFEGHHHYIMNLVFNPKDSNTFASACLDRTIKIWNIASEKPNFTMEAHEKGVNYVEYYPGNDKPYLLTTGDDRTVKIWDYHSKALIQTLESHTSNVSFAMFHPTLPVIISGSEDGTVKIWHSSTYRLENTLNYGLERAWCVASKKGASEVAIGYDEGSVIVKLGHDEPTFSMDSSGKLIYAKNTEILTANLQTIENESLQDGARVSISLRELGTTEILPQQILHSPNGRFVTAVGDGEYIIYTSLAWRNKAFGSATSFAWSVDSSTYAIREQAGGKIKVFKNFKERQGFITLPGLSGVESVFGGPLLAGVAKSFICFWDWESGALIRRIDVEGKHISWSGSGCFRAVACAESFFILQLNQESVSQAVENIGSYGDEGIETAFDVIVEINDSVRTSRWVSECFVYTSSNNKLNYLIGETTHTVHNFERSMYLLGYLPQHQRVYVVDKNLSIYSYSLSLSYIQYQSAIIEGNLTEAEKLLPQIPQDQRNKVARFLQTQNLNELALSVSTDVEHQFELALAMNKLDLASEYAEKQSASHKWKLLGDRALQGWNIPLAQSCFEKANDLSALLLIYTSTGDVKGLQKLAELSDKADQYNIAFTALLQSGQASECVDLLLKSDRAPEAAMFAMSYHPDSITKVVKSWKTQLDSQEKSKLSAQIADPSENSELFPVDFVRESLSQIKNVSSISAETDQPPSQKSNLEPQSTALPSENLPNTMETQSKKKGNKKKA